MRLMTCGWACLALFSVAGCCDQIKEDADALKARHSRCEPGDTCVLVSLYDIVGDNSCLGAFQCDAALNEADLDGFAAEAEDLTDRYSRCDECVQAGCGGTEDLEAFCDEETGKCLTREIEGDGDGDD